MFAREDGEEYIVFGEDSRPPGAHLMAVIAISGEPGRDMIGTGYLEIILLVTSHAPCSVKRQVSYRKSRMATLAIGEGVATHQGEIGLCVNIFDVEDGETVTCVTSVALRAELAFVDILVA